MRIAQAPRLLIISCFTVSVLASPQLGSAQTKPAMVDPAKAPIAATGIDEVYQLVDAVVTKVDSKTRTVTLKDKDGTLTNFVAGPEIKNFPQIKVGDRLTVTHELAVAIELVKVNNQGVRSEVQTSTQTVRVQPQGQRTVLTNIGVPGPTGPKGDKGDQGVLDPNAVIDAGYF